MAHLTHFLRSIPFIRIHRSLLLLALTLFPTAISFALSVNEAPGRASEWGFHPQEGKTIQETPPAFSWRPQDNAQTYEIQCSRSKDFSQVDYQFDQITYNVHKPPELFDSGQWYWRFRFTNKENETSSWSTIRSFNIAEAANQLVLPTKEDLLQRIPKEHPRLFVRPEQMANLKKRAKSDLRDIYDDLIKRSERLLNDPPPTEEPPKYPDDVERKSEEWREIWWGNRVYTIEALNGAATLAFTHLLSEKEEYAQLAKRILIDCAEWDPKGATGYRYNDEAGMPYNYYFARTYTFLYNKLSEEEREKCRQVMRIRGQEMYNHLHPRHLWRPYSSHSNRAWHFLGEVGIAFLDEIPEAQEWVWFAANVFANVYPVWSDDDGGWHEGISYWRSYINRFTWWADVMRVAMEIDAFDKPYFSQIGYYPMYLQPPGTQGGGFGDLTARRKSSDNCELMSIFSAQAQNPYWKWYVDAHDYDYKPRGYIGFVRGALPEVEAHAPENLPTSRCFWGTGQAVLNVDLFDAQENIEVIFKSSPFGTQSHGYESNNSFLLYAFGERLFIRSGRRDIYGSDHHRNWMWHTKSTNCISVNGKSQEKHTASAQGKILEFSTADIFDYVSGETQEAYGDNLDRFTRRILFIKPDWIVIFDTLEAPEPSSFEWYLHSPTKMKIQDQHQITVSNNKAHCEVDFLWPEELNLEQTDEFDPPPRPRVKLTEYHLTATPKEKSKTANFVTLLHPYKNKRNLGDYSFSNHDSFYSLQLPLDETGDRFASILLQNNSGPSIKNKFIQTEGEVGAAVIDQDTTEFSTFVTGGNKIQKID